MSFLIENISNLTVAIRTKINSMSQKLVPTGGQTGQVLSKSSNSDNDVQWVDPSEGATDESFIIAMSIVYGGK